MIFLHRSVLIFNSFSFMGGPTEHRKEVGTLVWICTKPHSVLSGHWSGFAHGSGLDSGPCQTTVLNRGDSIKLFQYTGWGKILSINMAN